MKTLKYGLIWAFLFIILSFSVNSATYTNTNTFTLTTSQAGISDWYGFQIKALANGTITNLAKVTLATAGECRVGNSSGSVLSSGTFSGNNCVVNATIVNGSYYFVEVRGTGGAAFTMARDNSVAGEFPNINTYVQWNQSSYNFLFNGVTYAANIQSLNFTETSIITPVLNFSNISLINNTYFNTSTISINTTVLNTSTNGNVNQTYYLYYNNDTFINSTQYATNNVNGSFTLSNLSENTYKIWFFAKNNQTNVTSSNYTFTIDTTLPTINTNINATYYIYNISGFNSSCSDTNLVSCNISINGQNKALNITSFNFTTNGNQSYTITARDLAGNTVTTSGVTLVNPYAYFYFSNGSSLLSNFTFAGNSYTNYVNVTLYNSILTLGANSLLFQKLGYANTYINFTVNTTSNINITTNITQSMIIVSVYDRTTSLLLTGTTGIEIIATTGFNTTTTTGQVNITNLNFINEVYTIKATNTAYNPEYIYFTYNNQQTLPLNLYLIATNLSNAGIVTVQLITDSGQRVNGAICSLLEWKPTQSAYVSVAQGETNINGEYVFNIEVGTKFYKISCTKAGETAVSNSQIFTSSGYTLPLQIGTAFTSPTSLFQTISYSMNNVSYNSTHDIIYLNASDSNGLITQICLNVYEISGINPTLLNPNNCSFSSTVNNKFVIVQKVNLSDSLIVKGEVVLGSVTYTLDSITYQSDNTIAKALDDYHLDILIPLTFVLIGIVLGLSLKPANVFISAIGTIVMVWFSVVLVPTVISTSIAIFITLISIMIIWGGSKPK